MGEVQVSQEPFILISRDGSLEVATMELPSPGGGTEISTVVFRNGRTQARIKSISRESARRTHTALLGTYRLTVGEEELWAMSAFEALAARGYLRVVEDKPLFTLKGDSLWQRLQPISLHEDRPIVVDLEVTPEVRSAIADQAEECRECAVRRSVQEACLRVGLCDRRSDGQAEAGVAVA